MVIPIEHEQRFDAIYVGSIRYVPIGGPICVIAGDGVLITPGDPPSLMVLGANGVTRIEMFQKEIAGQSRR